MGKGAWTQQGLSQGLLKGSKAAEPGPGPAMSRPARRPERAQRKLTPGSVDPQSRWKKWGAQVADKTVGQGRNQPQGHCHWGHLGGHQGQFRHLRDPDRNQTQGHRHWGLLGGHQGQVLQGQQGQVFQGGVHIWGNNRGCHRVF